MHSYPWQLTNPISAIVFDCDGTLTTLEGIDELAKINGVGNEVVALTQQAMGATGINPALFQARLALVAPTQSQITALGDLYYANQVPDVKMLISILQRLNKTVYIVSAGLNPAVRLFGQLLNIPKTHIFAVDVHFDQNGDFVAFEANTPLVHKDGKRTIVETLKVQHPRLVHIGDGLNDFCTHDIVTRFVGYGGVFYRDNIAACCDYYIRSLSLAPLLPLLLTQAECALLTTPERDLYAKGLAAIQADEVKV